MDREQIAAQLQDAWNRGDVQAFVEMLAPDAEWMIAEENPEARTLHGREEIRAYLDDWRSTVSELRYEVGEQFFTDDAIVTIGKATSLIGEDGPTMRIGLCLVWRVEAGMPVRVEEYLDAARARAAGGLAAS